MCCVIRWGKHAAKIYLNWMRELYVYLFNLIDKNINNNIDREPLLTSRAPTHTHI